MKLFTFLALTFLLVNFSSSARILFLFPTPSKSHMIITNALSTTLASKGHDVTVVSCFPLSKKIKNHRDIALPLNEEVIEMMKEQVKNPNSSTLKNFPKILRIMGEMGEGMEKIPEFKEILKEEFDLVIIGMFFNNFLLGYGDYFKCPTIMLSTVSSFTSINSLIGNPMAPNAVPHLYLPKTTMNFFDRVKNFGLYSVDILMSAYMNYYQKQIYDNMFPSTKYRSYDESLKNLSLILANGHFSQGHPKPNLPNYIEIGAIQVKPIADELPENFKKWIDDAKDGVIFFSLGTNAKTTFLPADKIKILLNVFKKLKQRVIMKWESDTLPNKPDNVMISKWVPQDDLLAHPNVKLFISHCGLGSVAESKFHGKPIVSLPIFADQDLNAEIIEKEGWSVRLSMETLTEEALYRAINEIFTNNSYTKIAQEFSLMYKDRPMNSRELAVYWVEYVIRHRGAKHMQYPEVFQNFFQKNSLDVIAFLIALVYTFIKFIAFIFKKTILRLCRGKSVKQIDEKKKRK